MLNLPPKLLKGKGCKELCGEGHQRPALHPQTLTNASASAEPSDPNPALASLDTMISRISAIQGHGKVR